jgi:hypothetical protein
VERVILAKFPYNLVIEDISKTSTILLEIHKPQNDGSSIVTSSLSGAKQLSYNSLNISSTAKIKSRSWVRDEKESTRGMLSRSTFDDQGSFCAPNINTYLFDIEMNIEHLFSGPKSCHLMIFVHGLLGKLLNH